MTDGPYGYVCATEGRVARRGGAGRQVTAVAVSLGRVRGRMAPRAAPEEVDVEALLREADAADVAARAALPTPEEERVISVL